MSGSIMPEEWVSINLESIADVILGQSPDGDSVNGLGQGIIFFQGKTEFGKVYPTPRKFCTSPKKIAEAGDILLSVRAPVGPTNFAIQRCAIGRGLSAIRSFNGIDQFYLMYFFKFIEMWLSDQGTGTTFKAISGDFLREIKVYVSPLAEQQKIAEKLDELLAQVDRLKARLDAIPSTLKRFRQSVLAAAVSGGLTEEWRKNNICTENDLTQLNVFRGSELTKLPEGWKWVRFDSVAEIASNLKNPLDTPDAVHIAPNHIESNTGRIIELSTIKIDGVTSAKHEFRSGQIIYSKIRPYLCKVTIVDFNGLCSADMYPINSKINTQYLFRWMLTPKFTQWASNAESRSVLPKINQNDLSKIPVPVPSLEEQAEIIRCIEHLFAYADQIEQRVKDAQTRVNSLTQSILAKAFRGELTAEWREQNPDLISGENSAAALLDRIKAERAAQANAKKPRGKAKASAS